MLFLYLIAGAFLFRYLEAPKELEVRNFADRVAGVGRFLKTYLKSKKIGQTTPKKLGKFVEKVNNFEF